MHPQMTDILPAERLREAVAAVQFVKVLLTRAPERFTGVRLTLGRFLALGLEFQLASDVLRTAIAGARPLPTTAVASWDDQERVRMRGGAR